MMVWGIGVLIGIVSGLITCFIIWLIRYVFAKHLKPAWENGIYKDVRIEGDWCGELKINGEVYSESIKIEQVAHSVKGEAQCTSGYQNGRRFKFCGEFRNLILTAWYTAAKSSALDRGAFSVRLEQNGTVLRGQCIFYHDPENRLECGEYTMKRAVTDDC